MMKKKKIKEALLFTMLVIVLAVAAFFAPQIFMKTATSLTKNVRYQEWEKLRENFEQDVE